MEKFIRQKYELKTLYSGNPAVPAARQNTGSTGTGSWSEEPPPLPPKPVKKFGFNLRSASSTFHRSKSDRFTPPLSPASSGTDRDRDLPSPQKTSKPSQVFGMKITSVSNEFDQKLANLRDMGFDDSRRNSEVLKSTNGNLNRAVEQLVRLGEGGSKPASRGPTPAPRTLTPVSMGSSGINGITFEKTRQPEKNISNNSWEIQEEAPQRAATQPLPQAPLPPRAQSAEPSSNSSNPFLSQPQQAPPQHSLASSFQNLQVSNTGSPQQIQFFQQSNSVPPMPQIPQQYQNNPFQPQPQQPTNSNPWQVQQQAQQFSTTDSTHSQTLQQAPMAGYQSDQSSNPFLRPSRSQTFTPSNPWAPQQIQSPPPPLPQSSPWASQIKSQSPAPVGAAIQQSRNPFGASQAPSATPWQQQNIFQQSSTASPAPMFGQQEYFSQQNQQHSQVQQQQMSHQQSQLPQNPWQQQLMQVQPQQTGIYQQQQQFPNQPSQFGQPPPALQPIRHDKSSILALYNMPQFVSRPLQTLHEDATAAPLPQQQHPAPPQRSVTMPVQQGAMGSMNLFGTVQTTMQAPGARHVSNESVDFVGMGASGRHSPDAFSGLSAQYMR